ncbi:hypothetical protein FRC03_005120, partial [Tulasnella sp. 419]
MGRKPKTISARKRDLQAEKDAKMEEAVHAYHKESTLVAVKKISISAIANRFNVSYSTLWRRLQGVPSIAAFNASKRHLVPAEEKVLLEFVEEQARRGNPLTHPEMAKKVNAILQL